MSSTAFRGKDGENITSKLVSPCCAFKGFCKDKICKLFSFISFVQMLG
jgi:hypothetical protein